MQIIWKNVFHDDGCSIQDEMEDPIAFHPHSFSASNNPDILYLDEAMAATDWKEFREAMAKEVQSHELMKHWELVKRSSLLNTRFTCNG